MKAFVLSSLIPDGSGDSKYPKLVILTKNQDDALNTVKNLGYFSDIGLRSQFLRKGDTRYYIEEVPLYIVSKTTSG